MGRVAILFLFPFLIFSCNDDPEISNVQTADYDVEGRLEELGIQLSAVPPPLVALIFSWYNSVKKSIIMADARQFWSITFNRIGAPI